MARRKGQIRDAEIVEAFSRIAFSEDTKDADRIRALDWLADRLEKEQGQDAVLKRLDEVLAGMMARE
jgi:hypothetical protein